MTVESPTIDRAAQLAAANAAINSGIGPKIEPGAEAELTPASRFSVHLYVKAKDLYVDVWGV